MAMIIHGDCLVEMKNIEDKSIDMVLTSPPYDNLRTYNDSMEWGEHVWKPVIEDLYRIVKDGGVVVWVVNDATIKGSETGTSFKQALYAKDIGFNLHDTMIWRKPSPTSIGSVNTRYGQIFEYMFVFSKGKITTTNILKDRANKASGKLTSTIRNKDGSVNKNKHTYGKERKKFGRRFNVWEIQPNNKRGLTHPATFPMQLAKDHIISWSNEGDIILDPFAGSGTTAIACMNTNRDYILIEKEKEYIDVINKRIAEYQPRLV